MEKNNQKEVEYMMWKEPWIDTKLNQEEMVFLNQAILDEEYVAPYDIKPTLAGNISRSDHIRDKDTWFYETVLKKLTERLFYRECNNYYEDYIEGDKSLPKFKMNTFWVNYQKQYEFNPLHKHSALYSFVVFMKIPTHWKEQHALPICVNSNNPHASDFLFVWSEKDSELCKRSFMLSPEDEGRMLFFPAWLNHQVYPFYECEEERITISGNIILTIPNKFEVEEVFELFSGNVYEEKKKMLEMMEVGVESLKKELKQMKKEREKEGLN